MVSTTTTLVAVALVVVLVVLLVGDIEDARIVVMAVVSVVFIANSGLPFCLWSSSSLNTADFC